MTIDGKTVAIIALVLFIVWIMFSPQGSTFVLEGAPLDEVDGDSAPMKNTVKSKSDPPKMADSESVGNTTSPPPAALLPKEVPVTDDFGQFSTDTILSGQNYLDPRSHIGYPETVGGVLRNANLQIRSEPPNPRDPVSIWNLSTITPEQMRPNFEIQDKEYS